MPSNIERTIEEYRQRLLLQEAGQMRIMAARWLEVEHALEAQIGLLASEVAEMRLAGVTVSQSRLMRLERYQTLLAQTRAETGRYSLWAAKEVARQQELNIVAGINSAQASIRAVYADAGQVGAFFDVLPARAVDYAIGYAGDGTPLGRLLLGAYPDTVDALTQALIDGTAMGRNPRETARLMADAMSGNLDRALVIARTEQIRAYREASRQQMISSGVVSGYIRRAALNDRTCPACLALDGTEYPTDELMEVHPNDRCFMQPKISGLDPVEMQTGEAWFEQQDAVTQSSILGAEYYDAWSAGQFDFADLASTHVHPDWGPSVRITPLGDLIN